MKRIGIIAFIWISLLAISCENDNIHYPEYPEMGDYGVNALHINKTTLTSGNEYSFAAFVPEGSNLKIIIRGERWKWYVGGPIGRTNSWKITNIDLWSQLLEVVNIGKADASIYFTHSCDIVIDYYENGAQVATREKAVSVN